MNDNPLMAYQRKPKFELNLPSNGRYWDDGSINYSAKIAVFPLTGQDELLLKNVSPMLIRSVLVEIINKSIPSIVNAWKMPSIDQDAIMIAIRCASYGPLMRITNKCTACGKIHESTVDLSDTVPNIKTPNYDDPIMLEDVTIWIKPLSFQQIADAALEDQRKLAVIRQLEDGNITSDERNKIISANLTNLSIDKVRQIARNIEKVIVDQITVSNTEYIQEWLLNTDRQTFNDVMEAVSNKSAEYNLPKVKISCNDCGHQDLIDLEFDSSTFLNK